MTDVLTLPAIAESFTEADYAADDFQNLLKVAKDSSTYFDNIYKVAYMSAAERNGLVHRVGNKIVVDDASVQYRSSIQWLLDLILFQNGGIAEAAAAVSSLKKEIIQAEIFGTAAGPLVDVNTPPEIFHASEEGSEQREFFMEKLMELHRAYSLHADSAHDLSSQFRTLSVEHLDDLVPERFRVSQPAVNMWPLSIYFAMDENNKKFINLTGALIRLRAGRHGSDDTVLMIDLTASGKVARTVRSYRALVQMAHDNAEDPALRIKIVEDLKAIDAAWDVLANAFQKTAAVFGKISKAQKTQLEVVGEKIGRDFVAAVAAKYPKVPAVTA